MALDPSPARDLMERFATASGVTSDAAPRRYLWTDAFAVCNWVGMGEPELARRLVDQVHHTLGRHRPDDAREGWISGLSDEEGARRPTAGGLRIGKPLPERGPDQPYDPLLEWERDGQYFHYLTRWVRALQRMADAPDDPRYHAWSAELARVAFDRFSHGIGPVPNRLYWKMSIDLTRPLVPSMGQHDPLDGYVVISEILARGDDRLSEAGPGTAAGLRDAAGVLIGMGEESDWTTEDPLGAGSLLTDAWVLATLPAGDPERERVLERVIRAAALSLRDVRDARTMELAAERRLAFRELGLAIGLAAAERLLERADATGTTGLPGADPARLAELREAAPMRAEITDFWLKPESRAVPSWTEHEDINTVMLATAVDPAGYLGDGGA